MIVTWDCQRNKESMWWSSQASYLSWQCSHYPHAQHLQGFEIAQKAKCTIQFCQGSSPTHIKHSYYSLLSVQQRGKKRKTKQSSRGLPVFRICLKRKYSIFSVFFHWCVTSHIWALICFLGDLKCEKLMVLLFECCLWIKHLCYRD